jgi:vacuolar-type H+-ATPase subunit B/Vma2
LPFGILIPEKEMALSIVISMVNFTTHFQAVSKLWFGIPGKRLWPGYNYTGYFDEISIYNKALSTEQIQTIYSLENGVGELLEN